MDVVDSSQLNFEQTESSNCCVVFVGPDSQNSNHFEIKGGGGSEESRSEILRGQVTPYGAVCPSHVVG